MNEKSQFKRHATELDQLYRCIQDYRTHGRVTASIGHRLVGPLKGLLATNYGSIRDLLGQADDYMFYKWTTANTASFDEFNGVHQALNLCQPKKDKRPTPADRLEAIQRLSAVHVVHYSHSWQGPSKAALLFGQDHALRIEFSDRQPLYSIETVRCRDYPFEQTYMKVAKASQFVETIRTTVDPRDLLPLHRLMMELMLQGGMAA